MAGLEQREQEDLITSSVPRVMLIVLAVSKSGSVCSGVETDYGEVMLRIAT